MPFMNLLSWRFQKRREDCSQLQPIDQREILERLDRIERGNQLIASALNHLIRKTEGLAMSAITDAFTAALEKKLAEIAQLRADVASVETINAELADAKNALAETQAALDEANATLVAATEKVDAA